MKMMNLSFCCSSHMKYVILLLAIVLSSDSYSQINPSIELDSINSNSSREEIQRYFGFENVLFRYTTQPYDLTMNVNESANFLDIGPLYLMILPLLLVFVAIKRRKFQIIASLGLVLYMISCLFFSKIVTSENQFITSDQFESEIQNQENFSTSSKILIPIYKEMANIFRPVYHFLDGHIQLDQLTYPLVFIGFFISLFLGVRIAKLSFKKLVVVYLSFGLLFFLLSAGILWYGFLLIPLSLLIINRTYQKFQTPLLNNLFYKSTLFLFTLCILGFFILRLSNIQPNDSVRSKGKHLFYSNIFAYSVGHKSESESLDLVFPGISTTLDQINSNQDFVYKIGTSLTIHIEKNNERIFTDNQLSMFYSLFQKYGSAKEVFKALKAYGFTYIIVDLHTSSIDRTPDKSLTKKFVLLLESLYNNPNLTLLSTDRKVKVTTGQGTRSINAVFGEIESYGNYAVYRLE